MSVTSADECFSNVDSVEELRRICSERDARISKLKVIIIRERKATATLKEELTLLTQENVELKASNRVLEDQIIRLSSNTEPIREINDLQNEITSLQEALKTLRNENQRLTVDAEQLRSLLSASEVSTTELNHQLTALQSAMSTLKADLVTHEAYKSSLHKLANDILASSSFLEGQITLDNQHDLVASVMNSLAECYKSRGKLVPVAIQTSEQIMQLQENSSNTENNLVLIDQDSLRQTCEVILELERYFSCAGETNGHEVAAHLTDASPKSIDEVTTRLQKCISLAKVAKCLPDSNSQKCKACPTHISTLKNSRLQLSELRTDLNGLKSRTNSLAADATRELDQLASLCQPIRVFLNQQMTPNISNESTAKCCAVSSTVSSADILKNNVAELRLQLDQMRIDIIGVLADCSTDFTESLTTMSSTVSSMYTAAKVSQDLKVRRDIVAFVQSAIGSKLRALSCGMRSLSELLLEFKQSLNLEASNLNALLQEFYRRKPDKLHHATAQTDQTVENQLICVKEGSLDYLCRLKLQEVLCSEPIVNSIVPGLENETRRRIHHLIGQISKIQVLYNKLLLEVRAGDSGGRRESSCTEPPSPSPRLQNANLLETVKTTLTCMKGDLQQMKSFVLQEAVNLSEGLSAVQELQNNAVSPAVNNLCAQVGALSEPSVMPDSSSQRSLTSLSSELVHLRQDLEAVKSEFVDYTKTFQTCMGTVISKVATLVSNKTRLPDGTCLTTISSNGPPPKMLEVSVEAMHDAQEEASAQTEDSAEKLKPRAVKLQRQVQDSFTVSLSEICTCDVARHTDADSCITVTSSDPRNLTEVAINTDHPLAQCSGFQTESSDARDTRSEVSTETEEIKQSVDDSISRTEVSINTDSPLVQSSGFQTESSNPTRSEVSTETEENEQSVDDPISLIEVSKNTDHSLVQSAGFQTESLDARYSLQARSEVSTETEENGQSLEQLEAQLGELHRQMQDSREAYQQQLADLTQHFELQAVDYDRLVRDKEQEISQLKETCDRLSDETDQISSLRQRTETSELQIAGLKQILENSIAFIESQRPLEEEEKDETALVAEEQFNMFLQTDQQNNHLLALIERLSAAKSSAAGMQADLREELASLRAALARHEVERRNLERHQSVRQSTVDLELANHQTTIDDLSRELTLKTSSLEEATTRLEEAESRLASLSDTNTKLQDRLTKMKQLLLKTRKESGELERRVAGLQTQLEEQESRMQTGERESVALKADLAEAQNLRASAEAMAVAARREAAAAEQKAKACAQSLGAERDSLAHKLTQLQREFEGYKVKVLHTLRNNSAESTANASWRDESSLRASTEIAHLKETVLDLERRLADVSTQLAATSKDYELTKFALSEEKERCQTLSQQLAASSAKFQEAQKEAISGVQQRAAVEIATLKTSLAEHQNREEQLAATMEALKTSLGARIQELETQLADSIISIGQQQQQQGATESPTEKAPLATLCSNCAKAVEHGHLKDVGTITRETQSSSSPGLQEHRPLTVPLEEMLLGESSPRSPAFLSSPGLWNLRETEEMANLRSTVDRLTAELVNSRRQLSLTNDLLRDSEAAVERLNEQAKVLKEEIRRHERNTERDAHLGSGFLSPISSPLSAHSAASESRSDRCAIPQSPDLGNFSSSLTRNEYLKNVLVKFFELPTNATAERSALVPVLTTLLALSPQERDMLNQVAQTGSFLSGTTAPTQTWSSYLPSWTGLS